MRPLGSDKVATSGPEVEHYLVENQSRDPNFGFLKPHHPLHEYYQVPAPAFRLIFSR